MAFEYLILGIVLFFVFAISFYPVNPVRMVLWFILTLFGGIFKKKNKNKKKAPPVKKKNQEALPKGFKGSFFKRELIESLSYSMCGFVKSKKYKSLLGRKPIHCVVFVHYANGEYSKEYNMGTMYYYSDYLRFELRQAFHHTLNVDSLVVNFGIIPPQTFQIKSVVEKFSLIQIGFDYALKN